MHETQRTLQDLVSIGWYKTFITPEMTLNYTEQNAGEDRPYIDLTPKVETPVSIACPFLMKSKTMRAHGSWKYS